MQKMWLTHRINKMLKSLITLTILLSSLSLFSMVSSIRSTNFISYKNNKLYHDLLCLKYYGDGSEQIRLPSEIIFLIISIENQLATMSYQLEFVCPDGSELEKKYGFNVEEYCQFRKFYDSNPPFNGGELEDFPLVEGEKEWLTKKGALHENSQNMDTDSCFLISFKSTLKQKCDGHYPRYRIRDKNCNTWSMYPLPSLKNSAKRALDGLDYAHDCFAYFRSSEFWDGMSKYTDDWVHTCKAGAIFVPIKKYKETHQCNSLNDYSDSEKLYNWTYFAAETGLRVLMSMGWAAYNIVLQAGYVCIQPFGALGAGLYYGLIDPAINQLTAEKEDPSTITLFLVKRDQPKGD